MTRPLRALVAGVFALWILACSGLPNLDLDALAAQLEPIPPPSEDWVGRWTGPDITLTVLPDGTISLERTDQGASQQLSAPARGWAGGLTIGIDPFLQTWPITAPPHAEGEVWVMTFDGVELTRGPLPASALPPGSVPEDLPLPPADQAPPGDDVPLPPADP